MMQKKESLADEPWIQSLLRRKSLNDVLRLRETLSLTQISLIESMFLLLSNLDTFEGETKLSPAIVFEGSSCCGSVFRTV